MMKSVRFWVDFMQIFKEHQLTNL